MEEELAKCNLKIDKHIHVADERWKTIEQDIKEIKDILYSFDMESLETVSDVFKGAVSFRKFVVGLAIVIASLSAIGGAVIWIIKQAIR